MVNHLTRSSLLPIPSCNFAPELLKGNTSNEVSDWWNLGLVVIELMINQRPFIRDQHLMDYTYKDIAHSYGMDAVSLIQQVSALSFEMKLLEEDVDKRLEFVKVIHSHPFFHAIDWEKLMMRGQRKG